MIIGFMIVLVPIFLVGLGVVAKNLIKGKQESDRYYYSKRYADSMWTGLWTMAASSIFIIIFVCVGISVTNNQTSDLNRTVQLKNDREILVARTETIKEVVVEELGKYPNIEKSILENVTPEILLSYPELKSSKTIMQAAKELKDSQDKVYKLDQKLNRVLRQILDRENSINVRLPGTKSYEEYFGKTNPLLK